MQKSNPGWGTHYDVRRRAPFKGRCAPFTLALPGGRVSGEAQSAPLGLKALKVRAFRSISREPCKAQSLCCLSKGDLLFLELPCLR